MGAYSYKFLPAASFTAQQVAPQAILNSVVTPAYDQQATVAAENAPLRVTFGTDRIGAQIAYALAYQGRLVLLCVWGLGEIDSITNVHIDDKSLPAGVTATHYTGTSGQAVDSTLVAAFAAQTPTKIWTSALTGIAYSVLSIPPGLGAGFPQVAAVIRGRKIYDDRTTVTAYSDNPALVLAHFLRNSIGYGMGRTVNSSSVISAANACDEMVSGEKRRLIGLTLDSVQSDSSWIESLRTYAGCFVHGLGAEEVKLIPDRPRAAVRTLDFDAGDIKEIGPIEQTDILQAPTFIQVGWRDTTSIPWRDTYGPGAYAPGASSGDVDLVPSQVALPGIRRRSQAAREEIERVNKLNLSNLSFWIDVFDEQFVIEVGDRVDVIHPLIGPSPKPMSVTRTEGEYGRYRLSLTEYDPAVYSDVVVAEPTWSDTSLPTPSDPPAPSGVMLTEENYQLQDGSWAARIKVTWTGVVYPFLTHYRVTVRYGADVIYTLTTRETEARAGPMQEGTLYQVDVETISNAGIASPVASNVITITGATQPPADVTTWLTAIEAGGQVFLAWAPVPTPGVTRYRLKYSALGGSYATATQIDEFDALSYVASGITAGTYRFYLVAVTRYDVESITPLTTEIMVTLDPSLLITSRTFTAPTLTSMSFYRANRTLPGAWVTDFGDGIGYGHADPNNATGTFTDLASVPFAHPHTAGSSIWESESWDLASEIVGAWFVDAVVNDLSGTALVELRLSPDNSTWTDYPMTGMSITASGRYVRVRITTTGTMQIADPVKATLTVAAKKDPNSGTVTTSASGATTVTLAGQYIQAKSIGLTPQGTTAKMAVWDNDVLGIGITNTFDIYAFNSAGVQIAADVSWSFEGI